MSRLHQVKAFPRLASRMCLTRGVSMCRPYVAIFENHRHKVRYSSTSSEEPIQPEAQNGVDEDQDFIHVIQETESVSGPRDKHSFQAETQQLLDIVARSLYSEKEVFIRELVSNSSDAMEKLRHLFLTGAEMTEKEQSLEIHLATNEETGTFILQDHGTGMTKEELIENLGTIARSGSKAFVQRLQQGDSSASSAENIIGQFGVGFYSAFMVANKVDVYTKSYLPDSKGYLWSSDGTGSYEIAEAEGVARGTKIIVHLKNDCRRFSLKTEVEEIIKKYSNFVGFPIFLNGVCINTVEPLWTLDPKHVTEEQHEEFYRFISNAFDKPRYHLHFKADAPLNIRSIFYIPERVPELYGIGRMETGVSLFSRRVVIQTKSDKLLPEWLRFVRGVVDSEDIPLNLSREMLQDSALIQRLKDVLTRRLIKFLQEQARKDRVKYEEFFKEYGIFLREGVVVTNDEHLKEDVAKLLRFESSNEKAGDLISLEHYVSRMKPIQKSIYYICAPSRELAETSPYFEALKKNDVEVLFTYDDNDEMVLHQLKKFDGRTVTSAETYLSTSQEVDETSGDTAEGERLSKENSDQLAKWMENLFGKQKVASVKVSHRLTNHPVMITVADMAAARRWLKIIKSAPHAEQLENMKFDVLQPTMEINPSHDVIKKLHEIMDSDPKVAKLVAEQLYDNGLISAGLIDDPRPMVARLNSLLAKVLDVN
ncbi:heat shock protein 75 kDa, mitochondrial-like isoform X2 [Dendronephthya gigantea]|uniref:heat shock protein 75 kDa, mitochondrial-like isoform X2 n=1 Tax=Dendronephthya gigantea TaxID=151771 RepID=UPI00106C1F91|nr:heat shock protein 75 kDa, mitochondrial-like isoform X2 [Dendronephthya gigantea]